MNKKDDFLFCSFTEKAGWYFFKGSYTQIVPNLVFYIVIDPVKFEIREY